MKTRVYNTVDWRKYLIDSESPRIKTFLDSRGADVFNQVCDNINIAHKNKQSKIVLLIHPNAGNVISISKSDFDEVYDIAINWFLKNEDYRMCSKIKGYKENLLKKKVKPQHALKSLI
tara:strand:- start:1513 stop:1866 length:354 start_codon:yes stop_codon:yes gene_type:complete